MIMTIGEMLRSRIMEINGLTSSVLWSDSGCCFYVDYTGISYWNEAVTTMYLCKIDLHDLYVSVQCSFGRSYTFHLSSPDLLTDVVEAVRGMIAELTDRPTRDKIRRADLRSTSS